jgi:hypothetical protein
MKDNSQTQMHLHPTEQLCDACLNSYALQYLRIATHAQLRQLIVQAQLRMTSPCTEECDDECFADD